MSLCAIIRPEDHIVAAAGGVGSIVGNGIHVDQNAIFVQADPLFVTPRGHKMVPYGILHGSGHIPSLIFHAQYAQ